MNKRRAILLFFVATLLSVFVFLIIYLTLNNQEENIEERTGILVEDKGLTLLLNDDYVPEDLVYPEDIIQLTDDSIFTEFDVRMLGQITLNEFIEANNLNSNEVELFRKDQNSIVGSVYDVNYGFIYLLLFSDQRQSDVLIEGIVMNSLYFNSSEARASFAEIVKDTRETFGDPQIILTDEAFAENQLLFYFDKGIGVSQASNSIVIFEPSNEVDEELIEEFNTEYVRPQICVNCTIQ